MTNQDKNKVQNKFKLNAAMPALVKQRPKLGCEENGADDHIGIALPNDFATVQSGKNGTWELSLMSISAAIDSFTAYDGESLIPQLNETNLNCVAFSSPKRIEFVISEDLNAPAYLVMQEVVENAMVSGWQFFAPTPFEITVSETENSPQTWQFSVSSEPATIQQIRFYENCTVSIEEPAQTVPMFQKVTSVNVNEINIWS